MGAYSPSNLITAELELKIKKEVIEPTLKAMKDLGHPYSGFLYAGLMIREGKPYLIEYNIRMGDPECQVLMMRLKSDLVDIADSTTRNNLQKTKIEWSENKSITIVLCARGYPGKYIKDSEIKNLKDLKIDKDNQVFHAGTYIKDKKILSNGGRVLNITSSAKELIDARKKILTNLDKIKWDDGFYRKDIGWRAIKNENN